jgi:hypothetical protein
MSTPNNWETAGDVEIAAYIEISVSSCTSHAGVDETIWIMELSLGFYYDKQFRFTPGGVKNFLFSRSSRTALRSTQPPIQRVPGALSPGVKRPGREVDHSPPTSAELKKMWIYTTTPPYVFMA